MACDDTKTKLKMLTKLRNQGNHIHNQAVLRAGKGILNVVYRPSNATSVTSYVPCTYCFGYYAKSDLWKHVKRCPFNIHDSSESKTRHRERHVEKGKLLMLKSSTSTLHLSKILATLTDDAITLTIKNDPLILRFGEQLAGKHGHDRNMYGHVRSCLRKLGRLLIELKKICQHQTLQENIDPGMFKFVVEAARNVAGFDSEKNSLKVPSLALKLGATLKKCANLVMSEALQRYEDKAYRKAKSFAKLISLRWTLEVNNTAHRTLTESRKNVVKVLPLSQDVKKLSEYLKADIVKYTSLLESNDVNWYNYQHLQKPLLTLIILFNRRRSGELSRMKLDDYYGLGRQAVSLKEDVGLSTMEQALAKSLRRIEITGKRGRIVPVLLTEFLSHSLDILVNCRQRVGVSSENKHVFASASSQGYVRGSDTLREFSEMCGAENPKALRSTNLRKHIATTAQILNLKENELDVLANFMGHDIRVHRQFYRLSDETTQLAKVSKILMELEKGTIAQHAGKRLDDIDININEELQGKSGHVVMLTCELGSLKHVLNILLDNPTFSEYCN